MTFTDFFKTDERGRTGLFYAAERGNTEEVKAILNNLTGTGISCQRLALINLKDSEGLSAIDAAERAGKNDIAELLRIEKLRMEFYE